MTAQKIKNELSALGDPVLAAHSQRFFKTAPGEYGEGDVFRGIRVPAIRAVAKKHTNISLHDAEKLLSSKFHEDRLAALILMTRIYVSSDEVNKKRVFEIYLRNMKHINNWDLVDISAPGIVGEYLSDKDKKPLFKLAKSKDIWERRVAIISTFSFIRKGDVAHTYSIAEILLCDSEDLIHKAVGWMLREAGKRDMKREELFLEKHYASMPRTMLRYAIEKFPEPKRKNILSGNF